VVSAGNKVPLYSLPAATVPSAMTTINIKCLLIQTSVAPAITNVTLCVPAIRGNILKTPAIGANVANVENFTWIKRVMLARVRRLSILPRMNGTRLNSSQIIVHVVRRRSN
jgi:hypothetical protein